MQRGWTKPQCLRAAWTKPKWQDLATELAPRLCTVNAPRGDFEDLKQQSESSSHSDIARLKSQPHGSWAKMARMPSWLALIWYLVFSTNAHLAWFSFQQFLFLRKSQDMHPWPPPVQQVVLEDGHNARPGLGGVLVFGGLDALRLDLKPLDLMGWSPLFPQPLGFSPLPPACPFLFSSFNLLFCSLAFPRVYVSWHLWTHLLQTAFGCLLDVQYHPLRNQIDPPPTLLIKRLAPWSEALLLA